MYAFNAQLAELFTADPKLQGLFHQVRIPLAALVFAMNLAVVLEKIPMSMGRTAVVFKAGLVGSWLGQVPASYVAVK